MKRCCSYAHPTLRLFLAFHLPHSSTTLPTPRMMLRVLQNLPGSSKSSHYSSQATSVGRCHGLLNIAQDLDKHSSTTFRNRPYIETAPDFCCDNMSARPRWEGKTGEGLAVQHGPASLA
ncbi:hypothetical protein C8F01DRAFT_668010 [Mycena amicta]|nr:hypothetical protein C8F01DRAFT_668010 [Mycena amicta]